MKLVVRSKTELSVVGYLGAFLLIVGPLAAAFSFIMFLNAPTRSYGSNPAQSWAIVTALASILPFVGYVMFSIGRETISHSVSGDDS